MTEVLKIPEGINGLQKFEIPCSGLSIKQRHARLMDGRSWTKSLRTEWKGYNRVRLSNCANASCPARRYIAEKGDNLEVYHIGEHLCYPSQVQSAYIILRI